MFPQQDGAQRGAGPDRSAEGADGAPAVSSVPAHRRGHCHCLAGRTLSGKEATSWCRAHGFLVQSLALSQFPREASPPGIAVGEPRAAHGCVREAKAPGALWGGDMDRDLEPRPHLSHSQHDRGPAYPSLVSPGS